MPLVERGRAPVEILAVPALERRWAILVDRAAFEHLAARVDSASAASIE
ncbi:transcriptional regulator, partial [Streptomyces sp. SID6139]|nr:transcriptional regulator [Streptomyces sp. SID6139]